MLILESLVSNGYIPVFASGGGRGQAYNINLTPSLNWQRSRGEKLI